MEDEFIDPENYSSLQKLDYIQIIFRQIERINNAGSKEYTGGVFEINKQTKEVIYISSPEHAYINAIRVLGINLYPFHDKQYKEKCELLKKEYLIKKNKNEELLKNIKFNVNKKEIIDKLRSLKIRYYDDLFKEQYALVNRVMPLISGRRVRENNKHGVNID